MPSLIDIRRRVRAVKSTQQITKAMKMVSSSKLRRAQERIVNSRPYASEMLRVFNNLATRVDPSAHPLLNDDPTPGRTLLIVITADRGLCGGFNANVIKSAAQFLAERQAGAAPDQESYATREVALALVGRKGRDFFMRRGFDVRYRYPGEGVAPLRALLGALVSAVGDRPYDLLIEGLDSTAETLDQHDRLAVPLRRAGVRRLNVSLDSLDRHTFARITGRDRHAEVLAGITAALAAGFHPVKLNIVALAAVNGHEVLDFVAFARRTGVFLRFIEEMPMGTAEAWHPDRYLSCDTIRRASVSYFNLSRPISRP